ncbi:MAG TPA: nuclear transport factor 2 family protein [Alphaproteobacteria bacterium]|jgi:hypothetical protein|nr:nuclear transport factor 2 family protein [Alphaproteobacteria bacterium]
MADPVTRLLLDRADVSAVMHRYCTAVDTRDWDLLASCFTADAEADFRSFGAREVVRGRDAWVAAVKATVGGLDATQHLTANHVHRIDGDAAHLTAYLQAVHWLDNDAGDREYTVGGFYDIELVRQPAGEDPPWRIRRYALTVTWARGNRHILRLGRKRAES